MNHRENIKDSFSREYARIKTSLESDLDEIHSSSRKIIDGWIADVVLRLQISATKNKRYFEESIDRLYSVVKNYFANYDKASEEKPDEKKTGNLQISSLLRKVDINLSAQKLKKRKAYLDNLIEDAKVINEKPAEFKKENYTSKINEILLNSDKEIKNVALVLSGRFCNSYGVKDRKPKRLWKWNDRRDYLQGLSREKTFQEYDAEQINDIRTAIQNNKYLKTKRKDIYENIMALLA